MKRYSFILMMLAAVACQHKDLCYDHPHQSGLEVNIDWTKSPDADVETMELFLFPTEGGPAIHHTFQDRKGGRLTIPRGTYRAICTNSGKGANRFSGLDTPFEEFEVTTRTVKESESSTIEPDMLYSSNQESGIEVRDRQTGSVTFYPEQRTPLYTIIVKNVSNLKYTTDCVASISALAHGFYLGVNRPERGRTSQNFPMFRSDDTTLRGYMTMFGHCGDEATTHIISLCFTLSDGTKTYYNYDITDRMNDPAIEGKLSATIVLDLELELPKPITNGSGFQPTLDGWQDETIDVNS